MDAMALQEDLLKKMKLLATEAASDECSDEQRFLLNEQLQLLQQRYNEILDFEHSEGFHPAIGASDNNIH